MSCLSLGLPKSFRTSQGKCLKKPFHIIQAVTSPAVVAYNGAVYVCGGAILEDGDGIDVVQRFDTQAAADSNDNGNGNGALSPASVGSWTQLASMLIPRSGSAACVLNGYIYVIGEDWIGENAE